MNAVQAALMMLKALGYFQYQDDFGDSYILATVKQATEVGSPQRWNRRPSCQAA